MVAAGEQSGKLRLEIAPELEGGSKVVAVEG